MTIQGSSTIIITGIPLSDGGRGNTGPTGPTGPTGAIGPVGATGATGIGIDYLQKINNTDGITVYLTNTSKYELLGLSGNAPIDFSDLIASNPFGILPATGPSPASFSVIAGAEGLTAYFKPILGLGGLSLSYINNDLIFKGITSNISLGISGTILYAKGNTAAALIDETGTPVFKYETVTQGITTQDISKAFIGGFLQAKSRSGITNINLENIRGITFHVLNPWDVSTQSFYKSGEVWYNRQYYHSSYGVITGPDKSIGLTFIEQSVFDETSTVTFGRQIYGSCCYCDSGDGEKTCLDYVHEEFCDSVGGFFSRNSCANRASTDCQDTGACCINGTCVQTNRQECEKFGGIFSSGSSCIGDPSICQDPLIKSLILNQKNFTLNNETDENTVCVDCYNEARRIYNAKLALLDTFTQQAEEQYSEDLADCITDALLSLLNTPGVSQSVIAAIITLLYGEVPGLQVWRNFQPPVNQPWWGYPLKPGNPLYNTPISPTIPFPGTDKPIPYIYPSPGAPEPWARPWAFPVEEPYRHSAWKRYLRTPSWKKLLKDLGPFRLSRLITALFNLPALILLLGLFSGILAILAACENAARDAYNSTLQHIQQLRENAYLQFEQDNEKCFNICNENP